MNKHRPTKRGTQWRFSRKNSDQSEPLHRTRPVVRQERQGNGRVWRLKKIEKKSKKKLAIAAARRLDRTLAGQIGAFKRSKKLKKSLSGLQKFNKRHLKPNQTNGETNDKRRAK
jgi:hypothetical protein